MPIDLAAVNWVYVGVLAIFVFVASLVGNVIALGSRGMGAVLSAILFAAIFVGWSYYPHGLPLPTRLDTASVSVVPPVTAPVAPAAPVRPANPVTTISPPPASVPPKP